MGDGAGAEGRGTDTRRLMVREYSMQTNPAEKAILGGGGGGTAATGPPDSIPPSLPLSARPMGGRTTTRTRKAFPKEILHRGFHLPQKVKNEAVSEHYAHPN